MQTLKEQVSDLRLQRDILNTKIKYLQESCNHTNGWAWADEQGHILDPGDETLECVECGFLR